MIAAQGCKIIAKDLEKSLAGLPMYIAHQQDEVEVYKVRCCLFAPRLAGTTLLHFGFQFYILSLYNM